jgi:hypothetical protein
MPDNLLDNEEFKDYVLHRAQTLNMREACDDIDFCCRLMNDVAFGRSKGYNRSVEKGKDGPKGLEILYREFLVDKAKRKDVKDD